MPDFNAWLGTSSRLSAASMIRDVARRIAEYPTTIIMVSRVSGGTLPGNQVVRLEQASGDGSTLDERQGANITISLDTVMVLGYKNNPDITNTDLKRGDRFRVEGRAVTYEVVNLVETMTDRLLASVRIMA